MIAPVIFPPSLNEGERGSAVCTVKLGEGPFKFEWLKDGHEIKENENIKIQNLMDSSLFIIQSVTSQSTGNYTCIVKNNAGSDRFTAELIVSGMSIYCIK